MDHRATHSLHPSAPRDAAPDVSTPLPAITETRFAAPGVRSLCWDGDTLVDWVGGGQRWTLDGRALPPAREADASFDRAVVLPGSPFAALFETLGRRGLILRDGQPWRELVRAEYCSGSYGYPIALFRLPSGRAVIAHCPTEYCCLQIDDLETGATLAACPDEHAEDYFPSGLEASPCGRFLVSAAGWCWHPVSNVRVYDLEAALRDPKTLGDKGIPIDAWGDFADASFLPDSRLLVTITGNFSEDDDAGARHPEELALYDLSLPKAPRRWPLDRWCGGVMPLGCDHTLTFDGHLRLLDLRTGLEVQAWPHIALGSGGHMACDSLGGRIAIEGDGRIAILRLRDAGPA